MARRVSAGILPSGLGDLGINGNILTVGGVNNSIFIQPVGTGIVRSTADVQIENQNLLRFADEDSSNYLALRAPATISADVTLTLPASDGSDRQVLVTNGSGVLSWATQTVSVSDNTTSTTTFYPLLTSVTTDTTVDTLNRSSTKLSFQPSSGTMTVVAASVTATTASTTTSTGALVVGGGAGIAGQVTCGTISSGSARVDSLGVNTDASGTAGEIRATSNITAYYSDDRLKTRLGNIENALDKVDQLTGFYFEPNETAQELGYEVTRQVGVSAQDVQKILPEIVTTAPIDDKYMTIYYDKLVPLLVEAIKELRAEVNNLKGSE